MTTERCSMVTAIFELGIGLSIILGLVAIALVAEFHPLPAASKDVVLSIGSALAGALSMKGLQDLRSLLSRPITPPGGPPGS